MRACLLFAFLAVDACAATAEEASSQGGAVMGGETADDAYAAVGAFMDLSGEPYCSGTLVRNNLVLTAAHCLDGPRVDPTQSLFVLGSDARRPRVAVGVRAFHPVPSFPISFPAHGGWPSDVMLVTLSEPIDTVTPIPIGASPTESEIGATFESVGFGLRQTDNVGGDGGTDAGSPRVDAGTDAGSSPVDGLRERLRVRLTATRGNAFDAGFGSYDAFVQYAREHLPAFDAAGEYSSGALHEGYEVYVRGATGRNCHGDSGGPLLRKTTLGFEVAAVTSFGFVEGDFGCAPVGTVYATFGPKTREHLDRVIASR